MRLVLALLLFAGVVDARGQACEDWGKQGKLLYADDFSGKLGRWHTEIEDKGDSKVTIAGNTLLIDVGGGATVWFKHKLKGDVLITFNRNVLVGDGKNDRLSDLNMFWMAQDPHQASLFTRKGEFGEYDSVRMYYAGIGGNTNTTSRLRRYSGDGERVLLADLSDKAHLLEANKEYAVQIAVYRGCARVLLNGKEYFQYRDPAPLREGYFGLRTTQSRHEVDDFKVYQLN